jgi:hypothetical protein
MARATIGDIQKLVYEYLRVNTQGSYGTYLSNQRYPTEYIDDEIYAADREISMLLVKSNQDPLVKDLYETASAQASGYDVGNKWVVKVSITGATVPAVEVTQEQWNHLKDNMALTGDLDFSTTYKNYFIQLEGAIHLLDSSDTMDVTYIEWKKEATIRVPSGFEAPTADLAAYRMLMNREDKPAQAQAHFQRYANFMAGYGIPISGRQDKVDEHK